MHSASVPKYSRYGRNPAKVAVATPKSLGDAKSKPTEAPGDVIILFPDAGRGSTLREWERTTDLMLKADHPEVWAEYQDMKSENATDEYNLDQLTRRLRMEVGPKPLLTLQDFPEEEIAAEELAAIIGEIPIDADDRDDQIEAAVLELRDNALAIENELIAQDNEARTIIFKKKIEKIGAIFDKRTAASAALVRTISQASMDRIEMDPSYDAKLNAYNPVFLIYRIARETHLLATGNSDAERATFLKEMNERWQNNCITEHYLRQIEWDVENRCPPLEIVWDYRDLAQLTVSHLNPIVFKRFQDSWEDVGYVKPNSWPALRILIVAEYRAAVARDPLMAKILTKNHCFSSKVNIVEAKEKRMHANGKKTEPAGALKELPKRSVKGEKKVTFDGNSLPSVSGPVACQLCGKPGHIASACFRFDDYRDEAHAAANAAKDKRERVHRSDHKANVITGALIEPGDSDIIITDKHIKRCCSILRSTDPEVVKLTYDTGADITLVKDLNILSDVTEPSREISVTGFLGASRDFNLAEGKLNNDFPTAVYMPGASLNIIADSDASKVFHRKFIDDDVLRLTSKSSKGNQYDFIRDKEHFGDDLLHFEMLKKEFKAMPLYQPISKEPSVNIEDLSPALAKAVREINEFHIRTNHMPPGAMGYTFDNAPEGTFGCTGEQVEAWRKIYGACESCLKGRMSAHSQKVSTAPKEVRVGAAAVGDLMFLTGNRPYLLLKDIASDYLVGVVLNGKDYHSLKTGLGLAVAQWTKYGHPLRLLRFDRESALRPLESFLATTGLSLHMTAAGQKAGAIEVEIREVKNIMRSTLAFIRSTFGYNFPVKFESRLADDSVRCRNIAVRPSSRMSPSELFTGMKMDPIRELRVTYGEPILAHAPLSGIQRGMNPKAHWGIVTGRFPTGVVELYNIETNRIVFRLKFERLKVPDYVKEILRGLELKGEILIEGAPEDFNEEDIDLISPVIHPQDQMAPSNAPIISIANASPDNNSQDTVNNGASLLIHNDNVMYDNEEPPGLMDSDDEESDNEDTFWAGAANEPNAPFRRRYELRNRVINADVNVIKSSTAIKSYRKALDAYGPAAEEAMTKELQVYLDKKVFTGVHYRDVPEDERHLILPSTENLKLKLTPDGKVDKLKARTLVRGDRQKDEYTGARSSPVARIESILLLCALAAYNCWIVFSIDFVGAYLNTRRPDEVKHKWVWLNPGVAGLLIKLEPSFMEFQQADGRILMQMDKLLYGYKESGFYWYKLLMSMWKDAGYSIAHGEPCWIYKNDNNGPQHITIDTDDCLCAVATQAAKDAMIKLCADAFEEITVQDGPIISHMGMTLDFSVPGACTVTQHGSVAEAIEAFGVTGTRHCLPANFGEIHPAEPVSSKEFMSLNQTISWFARVTYPELLPATSWLSSFNRSPTECHLRKGIMLLEYMNFWQGVHKLVLKPASLALTGWFDASHSPDWEIGGRGRSGAVGGFFGANVIFTSNKQSLCTGSSMETELVAGNDFCKSIEWMGNLLESVKIYPLDTPTVGTKGHWVATLGNDNIPAQIVANRGYATFKTGKHIAKRYFRLSELIREGAIRLIHVHGTELVADLLTKFVDEATFFRLLPRLLGWDITAKLEEMRGTA